MPRRSSGSMRAARITSVAWRSGSRSTVGRSTSAAVRGGCLSRSQRGASTSPASMSHPRCSRSAERPASSAGCQYHAGRQHSGWPIRLRPQRRRVPAHPTPPRLRAHRSHPLRACARRLRGHQYHHRRQAIDEALLLDAQAGASGLEHLERAPRTTMGLSDHADEQLPARPRAGDPCHHGITSSTVEYAPAPSRTDLHSVSLLFDLRTPQRATTRS
jgi:hypothetical protein